MGITQKLPGRPQTRKLILPEDIRNRVLKAACDNRSGFWRYYLKDSGLSYQLFISALAGKITTEAAQKAILTALEINDL